MVRRPEAGPCSDTYKKNLHRNTWCAANAREKVLFNTCHQISLIRLNIDQKTAKYKSTRKRK